jgi:hypothetical protein
LYRGKYRDNDLCRYTCAVITCTATSFVASPPDFQQRMISLPVHDQSPWTRPVFLDHWQNWLCSLHIYICMYACMYVCMTGCAVCTTSVAVHAFADETRAVLPVHTAQPVSPTSVSPASLDLSRHINRHTGAQVSLDVTSLPGPWARHTYRHTGAQVSLDVTSLPGPWARHTYRHTGAHSVTAQKAFSPSLTTPACNIPLPSPYHYQW